MGGSLFIQFLSMTISSRHISHGWVATRLRCGGIFNYYFCCKFITESNRKEFWKSVKIWQNYHHEFGGPVFFLEYSVETTTCMTKKELWQNHLHVKSRLVHETKIYRKKSHLDKNIHQQHKNGTEPMSSSFFNERKQAFHTWATLRTYIKCTTERQRCCNHDIKQQSRS